MKLQGKIALITGASRGIGHASALVQLDGVNILTDPVFSERASPFSFAGPKRKTPPGLTIDQLPRIDIVLISHNHYDHLDKSSIEALNRQLRKAIKAEEG